MATLAEIEAAVSELGRKYWDEDHPDYDEDLSEDYANIWERLYQREEWVFDGPGKSHYEYHDSLELPGLGTLNVVDRYDDHDDGHALYVVFTVGDDPQTYQYQGWYDSWGGDGGWEGPMVKVEGKPVTKTEWTVVK